MYSLIALFILCLSTSAVARENAKLPVSWRTAPRITIVDPEAADIEDLAMATVRSIALTHCMTSLESRAIFHNKEWSKHASHHANLTFVF